MTDSRSAFDEDRLPWLEAVDEDERPRGISAGRMVAALAVVLLAVAIVAATFFWLGRSDPVTGGAPELIRAEPGPYKAKPSDPGGLDVTGESETAYQTSAGEDRDARLDLGAAPAPALPAEPEAEAPAPPPSPAEPVEAAPTGTGGNGSVIQMGAFANRAQAERAWSALSARFPSVAALNKMIVPYPGGIRLRAGASSPQAAREACEAVRSGGENCFVAN
ncbi:MAG: SPOR domain-containing protein [Pseudomonadota bacterium]|nr:SPOR domain-containing protein [Pseudomonadota bacterium]